MSAAILFVALLAGSSSGLRTHNAGIEVHSMIPEIGTVCFESPTYGAVSNAVTMFRAGPLSTFSHRTPAQKGKSCAESGFSKLVSAEDGCFKGVSMYTKATLDVNKTLEALRARNLREIHDYADRRNISYEQAMKWTVCGGGCTGNLDKKKGFRWWGADRWYDSMECNLFQVTLMPALENAAPKVGSFVPDSGVTCWEGPFDYMEKTLAGVKRTPGGDIFKNATVMQKTCKSLGYGKIRDGRDECWTDAAKMMRRSTENPDMIAWVNGPGSLAKMMPASDKARGYPEGTSLDLFSCQCQKGGAARERAMWLTKKNELVNTRYSDDFCKDLNSRYLGQAEVQESAVEGQKKDTQKEQAEAQQKKGKHKGKRGQKKGK